MKENILITGASGFVGKTLIPKLIESNNLYLVSRDKDFAYPSAKVYHGDLSLKNFCQEIVSGINTVFYLAGYKKNIAYHLKHPYDFVAGNISPLLSFLEAVRNSGIKRIIYLSSTNAGLYKEDEEDGYVRGKYINEIILRSFTRQTGIDIKIVRAPGIYGPGDNFDPETANFIPAMINKIHQSDGDIIVWGKGLREIQFIYIDDLVSNLIEISDSGKAFFVVGNPEALTINQIVEKIIELSGRDLHIKNDATKPDKPSQLFDFDNLKKPSISFEEGLRQTIAYYKKSHA